MRKCISKRSPWDVSRYCTGLFYACLVLWRFRGTISRHATLVPSAKTRGILRKNAVSDNVCGLTIGLSTASRFHFSLWDMLGEPRTFLKYFFLRSSLEVFSSRYLNRETKVVSCISEKIPTLNKFELGNRMEKIRYSNLYDTNVVQHCSAQIKGEIIVAAAER